ncbi:sulfite exporter TauE/SafE family protein [Pseudomonas sp. MPC6]|uniref:sulfite exporter TauE/SafE family protein n=1 Tax=unclassified Pseudomonas TaxID=196821 RepID=UPI0011106EE9|nr:sulfite exporter TauE/SafE family protein [Pseudomonas sp. MPC6]QCY09560.1 sulfite exporter TauE/SafE family protein [Pseudomonas sp. MPC6]
MEYISSSLSLAMASDNLSCIGLILFFSLLLRAAIGFGDGLLAVPLLAMFIDIREAVPLIICLSTTISVNALWQGRRSLQLSSLKRTSVAALVGIPLGVMLLSLGNEVVVKSLLGVLLVAMALWRLGPKSQLQLKSDGWSYLFGGLAGMLGSAYALRGVVFSIYGGLRGWSQDQFKGTISGFYILSGVVIPISYLSSGLITPRLIGLYLLFLPLAFLSTILGHLLTHRLDADMFQKIIWIFLLLFGVFLAARPLLF